MFSQKPRNIRFASCKRKTNEAVVKPNLAYNPRDLDELRKKGTPISSPNMEALYYDGEVMNDNFQLPLDSCRGVDINDMWNYQQRTNKVRSRLGASVGSADVQPSK